MTCSCPLTPVVSKASSGAMETMPVYALSGCGLEHFLSEARGNGWTVLGTVGSERLKERERLGEKRRESEGQEEEKEKEEKAKAKKPPVMDCRQYRAKGPAIIVLGKIQPLITIFSEDMTIIPIVILIDLPCRRLFSEKITMER